MVEKTKEKKQTMRYTDVELSLIKNTFADNDDLYRALRKVFLQMPLDAGDRVALAAISTKEVLALIRKAFLPTLDPLAPGHQMVDLWMIMDLKGKTPAELYPAIMAQQGLINYLDQQLSELEGDAIKDPAIFSSLTDFKDKDEVEAYIALSIRNSLIGYVEFRITELATLAGMKEETIEETKKRLEKNSSK